MLVIAWIIVIFMVEQARFAILAPEAQVGVEAAAALARLFGALVLLLFPIEAAGQRLRWTWPGTPARVTGTRHRVPVLPPASHGPHADRCHDGRTEVTTRRPPG